MITITDSAVNSIISVMNKKNLDLNKVFFEIILSNKKMCIGFNCDRHGKFIKKGNLGIIIGDGLENSNIVIDFVKINDRMGIVFKEKT